jgi:hypothetical protein
MRISDADRARAVEELRRHCAAGRLDIDAYADRVAEAMGAETLADLDHALRDLPTVRIAEPSGAPPIFAPGRGHRDGSAGRSRPGGTGPALAAGDLRARLVVLLTVLVIIVGTCFLVISHWVWAMVLVLGWIVGVAQGRIRVGRR